MKCFFSVTLSILHKNVFQLHKVRTNCILIKNTNYFCQGSKIKKCFICILSTSFKLDPILVFQILSLEVLWLKEEYCMSTM